MSFFAIRWQTLQAAIALCVTENAEVVSPCGCWENVRWASEPVGNKKAIRARAGAPFYGRASQLVALP